MRMNWKMITLLGSTMLFNGNAAFAQENFGLWLVNFKRTKEIRPVTETGYQSECGDCHYAYPPGLLPARSWDKLLNAEALRNHFGSNAEIEADKLKVIHDYAVEYAADKSWYKRSRKIAATTSPDETPLRITELKYISRVHKVIPDKMVKDNPAVKSLSFCDKCHTQASKGVFDNDTVQIPNFTDWGNQK